MKKIKNKGITLIALIVTIIVLIILAGIAISMLTSNNNILRNSTEAREETRKATATEIMALKITGIETDSYAEKMRMPTLVEIATILDKDEEIEYVNGKDAIKKGLEGIDNTTTAILTKLNEYPYEFEVDNNFKIIKINEEPTELIIPKEITLAKSTIENVTIKINDTVDLGVTVTPDDTVVTWDITSGNEYVSISETSGTSTRVTGISAGSAKITATAESQTQEFDITVSPTIVTISRASNENVSIEQGKNSTLGVIVSTNDGTTAPEVSWSADPTGKISFSTQSGISTEITGTAIGSTTVTAKLGSDSSEQSVTFNVTVSQPTISTSKSYVGSYADVDKDGTIDGVIYADLAFSKTGQWGSDFEFARFSYSAGTNFKKYYVSKGSYTTTWFGTHEVISPTSGGGANNRFYIMTFNDLGDTYGNNAWWWPASGKLNVSYTSTNFGKGEKNTADMISAWNASKYGNQSDNDMWGKIQAERSQWANKGFEFFIPSSQEWAAFGVNLGITDGNAWSKGLNGRYWSSSISSSNRNICC